MVPSSNCWRCQQTLERGHVCPALPGFWDGHERRLVLREHGSDVDTVFPHEGVEFVCPFRGDVAENTFDVRDVPRHSS